jgi:hypothetical protein
MNLLHGPTDRHGTKVRRKSTAWEDDIEHRAGPVLDMPMASYAPWYSQGVRQTLDTGWPLSAVLLLPRDEITGREAAAVASVSYVRKP